MIYDISKTTFSLAVQNSKAESTGARDAHDTENPSPVFAIMMQFQQSLEEFFALQVNGRQHGQWLYMGHDVLIKFYITLMNH